MTTTQATAQVFLAAFKTLPSKARNQVVLEIIRDKRLREDSIDLAIAEERVKESSRPPRKFLSEVKSHKPR